MRPEVIAAVKMTMSVLWAMTKASTNRFKSVLIESANMTARHFDES